MKITLIAFLLFVYTFLEAQVSGVNHWETVIFDNDMWSYQVGISEPDASWRELTYNDNGWLKGMGGFGYADGDDNTTISSTISVYIRKIFKLADTSRIEAMVFHMDYDDAFVAYINDVEIARAGITGDHPAYNSLAASDHEAQLFSGGQPDEFLLSKKLLSSILRADSNVLAVQVHNVSSTSSDLTARAFLSVGITDASSDYLPTPSWFTEPFVFSGSNLPIVVINTNGQAIVDDPKIDADMKIIYNSVSLLNNITDSEYDYNGKIGIEVRGRYSASLPQKPYGFETRDVAGENLNTKLMGMPKENDWILLANYNDKVFMRNSLAFKLFREMGQYAPRTVFCEVMLNDRYDGIYVLTEKIKQDDDRVDIAKLDEDDNAGDSLTGGYIFKIDYYTETDSWIGDYSPIDNPGATVRYVYEYPKPDEITNEQKAYIKNYINAFETVLYGSNFDHPSEGYRAFVDVNSFVDYFIIGELSRNVDAYKKSKFYYKDKNSKGGLIHSGPVWDFDWAWKNLMDGCQIFNATDGSGWAYEIGTCSPWPAPSGWIVKMMQDTNFVNQVGNRYWSLRRGMLSTDYLFEYIDSVHSLLDEAQERHYKRWPILGVAAGAPETGSQPTTYSGEVEKFKNWIKSRLAWLDANMPEEKTIITEEPPLVSITNIKVFPNPAADYFYIEANKKIQKIEIYNNQGSLIKTVYSENLYVYRINSGELSTGIYMIRVIDSESIPSITTLLIK